PLAKLPLSSVLLIVAVEPFSFRIPPPTPNPPTEPGPPTPPDGLVPRERTVGDDERREIDVGDAASVGLGAHTDGAVAADGPVPDERTVGDDERTAEIIEDAAAQGAAEAEDGVVVVVAALSEAVHDRRVGDRE